MCALPEEKYNVRYCDIHFGMLLLTTFQRLGFAHRCPCQGFAEMMQHQMTIKVSTGDADTGEVQSFCAQEQPPPHVSRCVSLSMITTHRVERLAKRTRKVDRLVAVPNQHDVRLLRIL